MKRTMILMVSVFLFLFVANSSSAQKMAEIGSFVISDSEFNDLYSVKVLWDKNSGIAQNIFPKSYSMAASRFLAREYPAVIEIRGLGKNKVKAKLPGRINSYFFYIDKTSGFFKKKRVYETTNFNISWITPDELAGKGLDKVMGIFGSWKFIAAAASYTDRQWYWAAAGFNEEDAFNVRAGAFVDVNEWAYFFVRNKTAAYAEYVRPAKKYEVTQKLNLSEWLYSVE